ncbi:MAG: intradiol ring-cleavage dioxygenase [Cyanobacteria bacterium J06607_10]
MSLNLPNKRKRLSLHSRRRFIRRSSLFLSASLVTACQRPFQTRSVQTSGNQATIGNSDTQAQPLPPTPTCGDYSLTPSQTPGPFYSPASPQRQSLLEANTVGTQLVVSGQVLTTDCMPLANSLVDVWQTNDKGEYDNTGNNFRGHQFTDAEGRYWIETIVPGLYPGRTRHLHVLVQAPGHPVLTTQLYLPDEPENEGDFLFQRELLMTVQTDDEGKQAQFDFVIA